MGRLYIPIFDHGAFMHEVSELVEVILGVPVSEYEDWRRVLTAARDNVLRDKAQPVADYGCQFPACDQHP